MTAGRVEVRQQTIPGLGQRYQLHLPGGEVLAIVVDASTGDRELSLLAAGADEPSATIVLSEDQADAVATVLSGFGLLVETVVDDAPKDGVRVETLTVGPVSPLVGQRLADVALPDPEAARVVAVIRDDTPELFEDDAVRPCAVGDRVVIAGRPDALRELRRFLLG